MDRKRFQTRDAIIAGATMFGGFGLGFAVGMVVAFNFIAEKVRALVVNPDILPYILKAMGLAG